MILWATNPHIKGDIHLEPPCLNRNILETTQPKKNLVFPNCGVYESYFRNVQESGEGAGCFFRQLKPEPFSDQPFIKISIMIQTGIIQETIRGIVDRVTYHNPDNGWSVLRVTPFDNPHQQDTVIVHQTKVFAGATMEFQGSWIVHSKFGRQFKATKAFEKKPATTAALEKYLGSGLIRGVGPKTAKKIVKHFAEQTLEIFETQIGKLTEVPGIAQRKLETISSAWTEHRAIRKVMMFLQTHGISTLFAVRIYKEYGDNAISYVNEDPYRLAGDFYGIGFFSADKVALSIGLDRKSPQRIMAGIKHVLAASREFGHCYLTQSQISTRVEELLDLDLGDQLPGFLKGNGGERARHGSPNQSSRWKNRAILLFQVPLLR